MVLTCFDELVSTKGIVFMRGDLISHLDENEGQVLMSNLLDLYLMDSEYELVNKFNNDPSNFDYEKYIQTTLPQFN